jgi:NAD(P)H dehydrogenase (quinone)
MKIGIVVYSQTGNTLSVAEKLRDKLANKGHTAALEQLKPAVATGDKSKVQFSSLPDLSGYDGIVFAAPVQAFTLCAVMSVYLRQLPDLKGKKAACFVTKAWTSAWTGANKALTQITKAIEAKGAAVVATGFVGWGSKQKDQAIDALVEKIASAF